MKVICLTSVALLVLVVCCFGVVSGLKCYSCDSDRQSDCMLDPIDQDECSFAGLSGLADRFRCTTIHAVAKGTKKEFILRTCSTRDACKVQVKANGEYVWGGKKYINAKCEECQTDLCNKAKPLA